VIPPPSESGAFQVTVAWFVPPIAHTSRGAPGGAIGVTLLEGCDAGPVPASFVAVMVNV
jgi:hypothetical protein